MITRTTTGDETVWGTNQTRGNGKWATLSSTRGTKRPKSFLCASFAVEHSGKIVTRYLSGKWAQHYPRDIRSERAVLHDPSQFGVYQLDPITKALKTKQKLPYSSPEQRAEARRRLVRRTTRY